jgi:hypothetical protein
MGPSRICLLNNQGLTAVLWSGFTRIVNNKIIILGNDAELGLMSPSCGYMGKRSIEIYIEAVTMLAYKKDPIWFRSYEL